MKKAFSAFLVLSLLITLSVFVSASSNDMLSPALNILASDEVMIKSGNVSGKISFTAKDFELAVGRDIDCITITALPQANDGMLMYSGAQVTLNQTISADGLDLLYFVPASNCESASFRFKTVNNYSIECILKYTSSYNSAPTTQKSDEIVAVWTQKDISTFGALYATDPEGDELTFEIVDYPKSGLIELLNKTTGDYKYTPYDGVLGEDSFTYIVRDEWGNYSNKKTVVVDIDRPASELVFEDLDGHWAHNAALVMVANDYMAVESVDGSQYFNPDQTITREEFLVSVMKALGAGEIEPETTVFADNDQISVEASGYVARAYKLGIINGTRVDGLYYFNPQDSITRVEAAVIINSIVGAESPDVIPVFADSQQIPAWAANDFYALTNAGIFNGTGGGNISPTSNLNRAQTAQILLTIIKQFIDK